MNKLKIQEAAREYSVNNPLKLGVEDTDESYNIQKPQSDFIAGAEWVLEQLTNTAIGEYIVKMNGMSEKYIVVGNPYVDYNYRVGDVIKLIAIKQ